MKGSVLYRHRNQFPIYMCIYVYIYVRVHVCVCVCVRGEIFESEMVPMSLRRTHQLVELQERQTRSVGEDHMSLTKWVEGPPSPFFQGAQTHSQLCSLAYG